jgi:hypothetical protein
MFLNKKNTNVATNNFSANNNDSSKDISGHLKTFKKSTVIEKLELERK